MRFKRLKPVLVEAYQVCTTQRVGSVSWAAGDWIISKGRRKKVVVPDAVFRSEYSPEAGEWPPLLWCGRCKKMMAHRRSIQGQQCGRCDDRRMRKAAEAAERICAAVRREVIVVEPPRSPLSTREIANRVYAIRKKLEEERLLKAKKANAGKTSKPTILSRLKRAIGL